MKQFRRIGVFLHDSPADDEALAYTSRVAELANAESVLCVHMRESSEAGGADPDAAAFQAEVLRRLPAAVASRTKVEVHTGTGIPEVLRSARDLQLDVVVVGRRLPSEQVGIGAAFSKLARKCPCSVLVVPSHARVHLSRMLVPVDFSEHSKLALEQAIAMARSSGESTPQIVAHSVCSVGYGYRKMGVTLYEATDQLVATTAQKLTEFVAGVDAKGVALETVCTAAEDIERGVLDMAAVHKVDVVVVGSRGMSWPVAALLGSTAERILVQSPLPVLVVKKKGETTPLLNALLGDA
ncbi:MAG: universal stress protein [Phycisphaerae bacterium]|jgi:nucleotide-binding universal stress UspA family protein